MILSSVVAFFKKRRISNVVRVNVYISQIIQLTIVQRTLVIYTDTISDLTSNLQNWESYLCSTSPQFTVTWIFANLITHLSNYAKNVLLLIFLLICTKKYIHPLNCKFLLFLRI